MSKTTELLNLILHLSRSGAWSYDPVTDELSGTPELYALLDLPADQTLSQLAERVHPQDRARVQAMIRSHFDGQTPFQIELRLKGAEDYKWFLMRAQAEWNAAGEPTRLTGVLSDIDAEKRAQQALEKFQTQQKALYRLTTHYEMPSDEILYQGIKILCAYYDLPSSAIMRVQGGVMEMLAVEDPQARAQKRYVPPGYKMPLAGTHIGLVYDQDQVLTHQDLVRLNPAQHQITTSYGIQAVIAAPFWVNGEPYGVVKSFGYQPREFSEDEREFMQIFCNWLGFMFERRLFIDRLLRQNQLKERELAIIAHDLRSPLATIISAARRLERGRSKGEDVDTEMLDVINRACRQASDLMDDLLEVAELEQEQLKFPLEPINLVAFVQEVESQFAPQAAAKQVQLGHQIQAEQIPVALNPRKMVRVLQNLLHNALKFTPSGGEITLRLSLNGPDVWLEIADTGIGIPDALQGRLFEKYTPARRQGLRGEHANGLGMYIAREIVHLHGGSITVFSKSGQGTCIRIGLPLMREIKLKQSKTEAPDPPPSP